MFRFQIFHFKTLVEGLHVQMTVLYLSKSEKSSQFSQFFVILTKLYALDNCFCLFRENHDMPKVNIFAWIAKINTFKKQLLWILQESINKKPISRDIASELFSDKGFEFSFTLEDNLHGTLSYLSGCLSTATFLQSYLFLNVCSNCYYQLKI